MKRFLLLIALIISGMGLCAQNVGDNVSIDYVRYVLKFTVTSIEPAECEVVCTSKAASAPIVVKIPSTVTIGETEYNVTSLGYEAFSQKSISGVELPEGITSIGDYAFYYCTSLTEIEIPNTVVTIGDYAFYSCTSLTEIEIPNTVVTIGDYAFYSCTSLTEIEIPNTVVTIGDYAFYRCTSLTEIEIPNTVVTIGDYAFYGCAGLEKLNFEENSQLVTIRGYTFRGCASLKTVIFEDNSQLDTIANQAFYECTNLTTIDFGDNSQLRYIGVEAFYNCYNLSTIEFPSTITRIGNYAFSYCSRLKSVVCNAVNPPEIDFYTFYNTNLSHVYVPAESVDIYESTYPWYRYTIEELPSETSHIPGLFATIDYDGYSLNFIVTDVQNAKCEVICSTKPTVETSITIPSSVQIDGVDYTVASIGGSAFAYCSYLTSVEIPNTITSIGNYAFNACSNLTILELPSSITYIGYAPFHYSLLSLICNAETVPSGWDILSGTSQDLVVYVPSSSIDLYKNDSEWNERTIKEISLSLPVEGSFEVVDYGNYSLKYTIRNNVELAECEVTCVEMPNVPTAIVIPSKVTIKGAEFNVTVVENEAFMDCTNLTSIEIPNSVTSIGSSAFRGCSSLSSIEIPSGVTFIDSGTFYGCSSLSSIEIPSGVTFIGGSAFRGCSNLASVVFGENSQLTSIEWGAFYDCLSLASIEIPSGVTSIETEAFRGCSNLASVVFGENSQLTSIKWDAFYDCSSLASIEIPSGVTSIGSSAFEGCSSLASIEIPSGVTSLEYSTFEGCSSLASIEIPSGVTSIGSSAFEGCSSLSSIEIPSGVTYIGYDAFYGCSSLADVTFGENSQLTSIDTYAFSGCSSLSSIEIPSGVTSIGSHTFGGCSSLADVTFGENSQLTSIGSSAFYNCSSLASIEIPSGVTSIETEAFRGCSSLADVTFGENSQLTSIGTNAFSSCKSLASIEIPSGVTSIGGSAFYGCSSLADVTFGENSQLTSIGSYAFENCSSLTSIEIPSGVTSIDSSAFYYCSSLETIIVEEGNSVYDSRGNCNALIETASNTLMLGCKNTIIPETVTTIGVYAFHYCSSLASIEIPSGVTSIGGFAFYGCSSLADVTFAENSQLTSIGDYAFSYCTSLTSMELPNGIASIGSSAFSDCSGLMVFACLAETVPRTYSNSFSNLNTNMVIYVPESSLDLYKSSSPWNNYTIKEYTSSVGDVATIDYGTYSLMYVPKDTENPECEVFCAKKPTVKTMVSVPSSVILNGTEYAVTSIGKQAFFNCENITCLEIPATITYIGDEAFARAYYYNSGLRSMICHADSVPLTASSALNNYSNYSLYIYVPGTSVNLYKSVSPWKYQYVKEYTTSIVQGATSTIAYGDYSLTFIVTDSYDKKCQLVSADVPTSGTEIVIPSTVAFGEDDCSVTSIGSSAFRGCSSLSSIEIPSGVTSIGYEAFRGCSSLADVTFGENSQLTSIGSYAFYNCSSLTSIEIPSGVTSIDIYAFYGCSSLSSIEIPSGVTSIGGSAFSGCSSLENIVVEEDNTVYDSRGNCNALIVTESNTLLVGCRNTIIPETVTSIESSAFYGCSSLSSIEIPSGVTSIGSYAFCYCSSLADVTFGENSQLTSIGYYAFENCSSLSSIEIPSGVTFIDSGTFLGCSSLSSIEIPSGVTSIESYVFRGCSSLSSIEIPSGVTSIGYEAFRGCSSLSSIEIPSGVTSIGYDAFYGCSSLADVTFGENSQLTSIESYAFSGCSSLSSIEIPSGVTFIDSGTFYGCSSLSSIEIPSGVTSIGYDAFCRCSSLASVIFEENSQLISIANDAFRDCSSLTSIEIPDGVASIGDYSFYSCDALENVTIPSSVTSIGYYAFAYSSIKNFRCYAENVPQTDSQAFGYNSSMIVYVPEASIESYEMAIPWFNYIIMAIPTHSIDAVANPEIAGDVSGTGIYMDGLSARLNATPNFGYLFENWTENGEIVSTSAEYTFKVLEDKSLVANFFDAQSVLISINIEESGVVTGVGTYNSGDTVTVTATANEGYAFVNWTENGEVVSAESEYSFVITEDRNLTANFIEIYDVTLSINIEGSGTVTGDGTYSNGSTVTVVATPNENYAFVSWTEDGEVVSTEAEYSFVITEDVELQANFIETYDVALSVNIEDSGVITGDGTYNNGETVTLTATANEGYIFVNWTEDGEEVTAETEFTFVITEDRSFVANFIAIYDVTLSINIEGAGEVTGAGTFTDGETVTVTATTNEGYAFVNWTENGEVVSTESEYSFVITEDRNLTANFIEIYDVTLSINIEGAGTVTGDGTYSNGSTVTVVATANEGYAFVSWTEDGEVVSTEAEYSFVITEDVELQANFIETYDVALSVNIEDSGVITGDGTYNSGETVTLTATANEGYIFVNWTEDGEEVTAETEFTFVITEDRSFVANFIAIYDVTLSINIEGSGEVTGAGTFTDGETVTVTATANEGYIFVNWTEDGEVVSAESEYSFEITEDRNLTANFIEIYDVTLSINIEGAGTVTGDGTYSNGSTVTVVATANEGYAFVSWTEDGEVVSTEAEYSFEITEDVELQANFIETYDVALSVNIEDSGVITGDGTYNNGETVTITATANEGYIFVNWTEDGEEVTAETEFTFVITEDRSFVANFIAIYDVTLSINIEGSGEVTGAGTFTDGETVTVTATTNEGYAFVNWTEDGEEVTAETEFTFVITEDRSFVANFIAIYDLALSVNIEGAGEVTGAGTFTDGETVTVTATANEGYEFVNWTEDGEVVSTEAEYSFVITGDMELVANFVEVEGVDEQYAQTLSLYPNPTNVNHPISLGMIYDKVEVYNSIGVRIADYSNVDSIDGMEAAGIYIIRVVNDKDVKFSRIVVR